LCGGILFGLGTQLTAPWGAMLGNILPEQSVPTFHLDEVAGKFLVTGLKFVRAQN
jgi:hypothetical protein